MTSSTPTFNTPASAPSVITLSFELTASNTVGISTDSVDITVHPAGSQTQNFTQIPGVTVSASAESPESGQSASKAIDGVADGYPGDFSREWAAPDGGIGTWIQIDWNSPQSISQIVLYDRPNGNDHITAGTLSFSNGSSVAVGELPNNGDPLTIDFSTRTTDWVRFTVDAVSGATRNPGLAEFEVFNNGCITYPSVRLVSPQSTTFQTSNTIDAVAITCLDPILHSGWGTKFTLNGGVSQITVGDPSSTTFTSVPKAEHTVSVEIVDNSNLVQPGLYNSDSASNVGIGDYYVALGDSITFGTGDDITSDDVSSDGRNTGPGYSPILTDLLTADRGYPNFVANEGIPGINSRRSLERLPEVLAAHPEATAYLVKIGINDSNAMFPVPSGLGLSPGQNGYQGTYKQRMTDILTLLNAAGKDIYMSKLNPNLADTSRDPRYADPTIPNPISGALVFSFNDVIDELKADPANQILGTPIELHTYFLNGQRYNSEYADHVHPNGLGYQSMANLWLQLLNE